MSTEIPKRATSVFQSIVGRARQHARQHTDGKSDVGSRDVIHVTDVSFEFEFELECNVCVNIKFALHDGLKH